MTDNMLDFLKAAFGNDSSCVLILDTDLSLVWHNEKPAPFNIYGDLAGILGLQKNATLSSGDYSFSVNDIIYDYHLTAAEDHYVVSICRTPSAIRTLERTFSRNTIENTIAMLRQNVLSISASAAQLNECFESFEDDSIHTDTLNEQINMIMCRCANILKSQYTVQELLKYFEPEETEPEVIDCSELIRHFSFCCQSVFGPRGNTRITCNADEVMPFRISPQRLEFFLMCVLLTMQRHDGEAYQLNISVRKAADDIDINFRLIPVGNASESPRLLSDFVPLHKESPQHEMEKLIISRCLERYNGVMIESVQNGCNVISIRFPAVDDEPVNELEASVKDIWSRSIITPYHAMLSEISDFRYY